MIRDEQFDLLARMGNTLGLKLTIGETGEHDSISTVCIGPKSDPEGPPEDQLAEVHINDAHNWLLAYEAAAKHLKRS